MILDRLEEASRYCRLHPGFDAAFDVLRSTPFEELEPGRHEIMGDSLVLIFEKVTGKGHDGAKLEAHKKYIDIQYVIPAKDSAAEEFGWRPTAGCTQPAGAFDKAKDIIFYADKPDLWFPVPPGHFVVFFPSDAHAPLAGAGNCQKAVVKVAVDW
ncbi:MAG TPA: YhcH/YjgK/YiaL family protein [Pirellulales bacterium]|jgi:YhcH/YjgK/YiaL family protein